MGSYAGIDWASEKHDVLIADEDGGRLLAETFAHDGQGVGGLGDGLVCFEVEVVAIERCDGVLVERLLAAGGAVICAATLLAEIGDCRRRYPRRNTIAADGGQAPVAVEFRQTQAREVPLGLQQAPAQRAGHLAHRTRRWNPWATDRYAQARARRHIHRRTLRTLGRAWSRII